MCVCVCVHVHVLQVESKKVEDSKQLNEKASGKRRLNELDYSVI